MIRIYGSSDDLVEMEGSYNEEFAEGDVIVVGEREPSEGINAHGVQVRMTYGDDWSGNGGVWSAAIAMVDEGSPVYDVDLVPSDSDYSLEVAVHSNTGAAVTVYREGKVVWRNGKWMNR